MAVLLLADGSFQGNGLLGNFQHFFDFVQGDVHPLGDLLGSRLPPQFLEQIAGGPDQLVDGLNHMHRNADGPGLVGNGPGNGLADPPGGIGAELVAPLVFELVNRLHQPDVPLLNQVQKLQAAVGVLFGNADHQPEVGPDQFIFRPFGLPFTGTELEVNLFQISQAETGIPAQLADFNRQILHPEKQVVKIAGRQRILPQKSLLLSLVSQTALAAPFKGEKTHAIDRFQPGNHFSQALTQADVVLQFGNDIINMALLQVDRLEKVEHLMFLGPHPGSGGFALQRGLHGFIGVFQTIPDRPVVLVEKNNLFKITDDFLPQIFIVTGGIDILFV